MRRIGGRLNDWNTSINLSYITCHTCDLIGICESLQIKGLRGNKWSGGDEGGVTHKYTGFVFTDDSLLVQDAESIIMKIKNI